MNFFLWDLSFAQQIKLDVDCVHLCFVIVVDPTVSQLTIMFEFRATGLV